MKFRDTRKAEIIRNIPEAKTITQLTEISGISRTTLYKWFAEDNEFKQIFEEVIREIVESAVDEAKLRAAEVTHILIEVALDKSHPQWKDAIKEYHRVLERKDNTLKSFDFGVEFNKS